MNAIEAAVKIIKTEEGYRGNVYHCSEGYPTVGYGIRVGSQDQPLEHFKDFPHISKRLAEEWLRSHLEDVLKGMESKLNLGYIFELDPVRQAVVASMVYQLGIEGFLKFKKTIKLLEKASYSAAAVEMLDSLWARQTPARAQRHSHMLATNELLDYYGYIR